MRRRWRTSFSEVQRMTVSMRVMSAGAAYRYLLKSVAVGDGTRDMTAPLIRYYSAKGAPPGRWFGSGLPGLGAGEVRDGDEVTEQQLRRLLGEGRDPVTGAALGRTYQQFRPRPDGLRKRRAVAGFDHTFSVPKSLSALWAVSDGGTQALIAQAHHESICDVLAIIERDVAATRVGMRGPGGAVAQVPVRGVLATGFDHYDSRAADPHLHTHMVIVNRAQGLDGRWRTLDGRPIHAAVVALSETFTGMLMDRMHRELGVDWEQRDRGERRAPAWEITRVPEALIAEFSSRSHDIDAEHDRLVAGYVAEHGRRPSRQTIIRLRQQATISTRPKKNMHSLAELTEQWRARAGRVLGRDATTWAGTITNTGAPLRMLRADDWTAAQVEDLAQAVIDEVGEKRSTWRRWNLIAEAARQTTGHRFASAGDRDAVLTRVADAAEMTSLRLTPPEMAPAPPSFTRADGSSMFRPLGSTVFSSERMLAAEQTLLRAARTIGGPTLTEATILRAARYRDEKGRRLADDQLTALARIGGSGLVVDLLVGPAGTGKTTMLAGLRRAWESDHGRGSVVGLAPTAAAADVLGQELRVAAENTTKFIYEADRVPQRRAELESLTRLLRAVASVGGPASEWEGRLQAASPELAEAARKIGLLDPGRSARPLERMIRRRQETVGARIEQWQLGPEQLLIVDEAAMVGTFALERLTLEVRRAGAKLLLVGDAAQMQPIDSGGTFGMLANERHDTPTLMDVRRFTAEWERTASLRLRLGDDAVLEDYAANHRITSGSYEQMVDAAYSAWRADTVAGRRTILVAETLQAVTELNERARYDRVTAGHVAATGIRLHDGTTAGTGDQVITRKIDRRLSTGRGWVKNNDRWTVTATHLDGSLTVRRADSRAAARVRLPAAYVAEHVDLGYAITVQRAQGLTVDTSHALVASPSMTREALYVALTRGRHTNIAYVAVDQAHLEEHQQRPDPADAIAVLTGILQHTAAELSARDTLIAEQDRWVGISQLAAEYETIAAEAGRDRWTALLADSGLTEAQLDDVLASDAIGPLFAELRRAEADRIDLTDVLPRLVAQRPLHDAGDIGAVLLHRLSTSRLPRGQGGPRLIAGLVPEATDPGEETTRQALTERADLITARGRVLAETAIADRQPWTAALGQIPVQLARREAWLRLAVTVAAYRDRHGVTDVQPLGPETPQDWPRTRDRDLARRAIARASQIADAPGPPYGPDAPTMSGPTVPQL
jgi:conjugative relaxase-like TrwC/TraI family protein